MVAVKLLDTNMSGSITFENILSARVLEWLVILVVKLKVLLSWRQENLKIHLSDYIHCNSID